MASDGPRYYVQGETVRGEPRVYWVVDRQARHRPVTNALTDRRQVERICKKMNAECVHNHADF